MHIYISMPYLSSFKTFGTLGEQQTTSDADVSLDEYNISKVGNFVRLRVPMPIEGE